MRTRRLVLSKETLAELGSDELLVVMGGGAAAQAITPVLRCVADVTSKVVNCVTLFEPCTTR